MLQTLNFYGSRLVNAQASFFRYESGSAAGADESIRVRADGNDLGIYYPGDSLELPAQAGTWEITPVSEGCTGIVRLGVGRVQSARLVGTVSVVDTAKAVTLAGAAYVATQTPPAAEGAYARVQLWNPAGSGKRVIVKRVHASIGVAGRFLLNYNTVQEAGTVGAPNSKLGRTTAAAAASSVIWSSVADFLSNIARYQGVYDVQAGAPLVLEPQEPFVLDPGFGLSVTTNAVNAATCVNFDMIEEVAS